MSSFPKKCSFVCITVMGFVGGWFWYAHNCSLATVFTQPGQQIDVVAEDFGTIVLFARDVEDIGPARSGEVLILRFEKELLRWRHVDRYGKAFFGEMAFVKKNGLENYRQLEHSTFDGTDELRADNYHAERVPAYELLEIPKPRLHLELYVGNRCRFLESWKDISQLVAHQSFRAIYHEGLSRSPADKQGSLIFDETIWMIYGFQRNIREFK